MLGSDFLQLDPVGIARGNRADWLAASIRRAILGGTVAPGTRLPATRVLAAELGFSRGTVAEAYRRLAEEALVVAHAGAGTMVAADAPSPFPAPDRGAQGTGALEPDTTTSRRPEPIDLATGLPDLAAFPRAAWLRAERQVLATATARQLGYAPPAGTSDLRCELSAWLGRSRGVVASEDRLMVTAGVTGALSLLAQILRTDGHETVAVEDPSAEGNRRILGYWMPRLAPVPVDDDGIDVAALTTSDAETVLVTPAHQYPTGVVLSPGRRRDLLAWAGGGERIVIEDDYDAEYRYDRRPVRALQPLAPEVVAYTASLSKTLAPALRIGWLVPPRRLHERLVELRWATDLGSPALPQLTLARLLRDGTLERHLRTMRIRHRARRDAAVAALREHLPRLPIGGIAAGLHLVLYLPDNLDDERIVADAHAAGVVVQPLSRSHLAPGRPGLVVSYAAHHPARLHAAVRTLAQVIPASRAVR